MMTKQKGFVAALLMTTAFTPMRTDAACTPTPDCAELGYTQTLDECPDSAVKCPWDTSKVFCYGSCGKAYKYTCDGTNETVGDDNCGGKYAACGCASGYKWENGRCVQDRPFCRIGDIYYTDNTCVAAAKHDSTKEVLGIVVHVNDDDVSGQIMTPWPIDKDGNKTSSNSSTMPWGGDGTDIAGLPNYFSGEAASKDYNSCSNTDIIVKQGNASKYPAAWATRRYAPNEATKGKWCLPAAGIMTNIYNNKNAIQTAISKVGGVNYPDCCAWSSSEYYSNGAWSSNSGRSYGLYDYSKIHDDFVRPVLEF